MKKSQIRELLSFTSKERSGIIVLTVLLLLSIATSYFLPIFLNEPYSTVKYDSTIYAFQQSLELKEMNKETFIATNDYRQREEQNFNLQVFDPNKVNQLTLEKMGFSEAQVTNVLNYRKSGGKFYDAADFSKLYTLDSASYKIIKPFIRIQNQYPVKYPQPKKNTPGVAKDIIIPIELNNCTEKELMKKFDVPSFLAQRIIKYRDLLGGFAGRNQLLDVYGFDWKGIDTSMIKLHFDKNLISKIKINTGTFKDFVSHPYIDKYTANAILEYRDFMGEIKDLDELQKNKVFSKKEVENLKPYLSFD